jgi:lipopolysaccharide transport system permease protein
VSRAIERTRVEPGAAARPRAAVERHVGPECASPAARLGELWRSRELIAILVWRDLRARYGQTVIGVLWAVLQPTLNLLVLSILFNQIVRVPTGDTPYLLFALAGLVPWAYFVHAITTSTESVSRAEGLVRRAAFPRAVLPLASVAAALIELAICFALLLALMALYGTGITTSAIALPLFAVLLVVTALGAALWLSAIHAEYRDVGQIVPFFVQALLLMTPVAYPSALLPEGWRLVYAVNPLVGVVEGFRWALLGGTLPLAELLVGAAVALALLASGVLFFFRREDRFPDVV